MNSGHLPSAQPVIMNNLRLANAWRISLPGVSYTYNSSRGWISNPLILFALFLILLTGKSTQAQDVTFPSGSLIIDMGIVPQTVNNALKPYGMIYSLIKNQAVPVNWIIDNTKAKDGADFVYNSYSFKGGPFIIAAPYLIPKVMDTINVWRAKGVVTVTTTSPITVPVFKQLVVSSIPRWTLDYQNGAIAQDFFTFSGIPPSAYGGTSQSGWKTPAQLNQCDDIFVMPHADPIWSTHQNLLAWNRDHKGSIWLGCHAGSALEDMFNPSNPSQQTNFLCEKTGIASGTGPYFQNALVLWGNHSNGTPPYSYDYGGDPVMQFMGPLDGALLNGSEQIYIPAAAGWRPTTRVSCFDPDHPQRYLLSNDPKYKPALIAYGPAYGVSSNGWVMLEAAHDIAKATLPANVAAVRAFFNFSFLAAKTKDPDPEININLGTISSGSTSTLTFTVASPYTYSDFTIQWSSSCGGTFSAPTSVTTDFTAPQVNAPTPCIITVTLTQKSICARVFKNSTPALIVCALTVTSNVLPTCDGSANGSINITNIVGGSPNYNWSWTKAGGGSGSGSSAVVPFSISNLAPGNYTVSILALNGSGCGASFTTTVNQNPAISIAATPVNVSCNAGTNGAINVSVSGGTPAYTYDWADIPGTSNTQNRNNLAAGTYNLTVTDSKLCTKTTSVTITQPNPITASPTATNINCYGESTGTINLAVSGGTPAYTFLWNDGNSNQNRTGMPAGTFSVRVTDALGCTKTSSATITQPAAALTLSKTQVDVHCYGNSTGSINLSVSGGTSPYAYLWTNGSTTEDISGLSAGSYTASVTDNKGCTGTLLVTITQPAQLTLSTATTNPTCQATASPPANSDGAINLTVNGGTGPFTYAWTASNGGIVPGGQAGGQDLTLLVAGTYSVLVTDNYGCTATTSVTLTNLNPAPTPPGSINH